MKAIFAAGIYLGLLWLRCLLASLSGYVHCDEFFQSPEITARSTLGVETYVPWEYQPDHAARSVIFPFLTTGLPFWLLTAFQRATGAIRPVHATLSIFLVQRTAFFFLSLLIDWSVFRICRRVGQSPHVPVLLVATSQAMFVFSIRPFSNAVETVVLGLSLSIYADYASQPSDMLAFGLGCLLSLGIFSRITFLLYGFPVGLGFLWTVFKKDRRWNILTRTLMPFVVGAALSVGVAVLADSVYFGTLHIAVDGHSLGESPALFLTTLTSPLKWSQITWHGTLTLTPLNNLLYNINVENVKQHGLHPRYLHLLVNFPMLFGPLAVAMVYKMKGVIARGWNDDRPGHLTFVLLGSVIISMLGLSLIPHQECRFLLPMLVPLVLLYSWNTARVSSLFWATWIIFAAVTTVALGIVHQAGLVPTLGLLQRQSLAIQGCKALNNENVACNLGLVPGDAWTDGYNVTTHLIFYKTYMPPRHLLGYPLAWKDTMPIQINLQDLAGNTDGAQRALQQRQGVSWRQPNNIHPQIEFTRSLDKENTFERTLFVAPSMAPLPALDQRRYQLIASYFPHVTDYSELGDMVQAIANNISPVKFLSLNVYLLLSEENDLQ